MKLNRAVVGLVAILSMMVLAACGGKGDSGKLTVKVGSKDFTEQFILAELYAQALEAKGYKVERSINLGGTLIAHKAVESGEIDVYPEYTGTALKNIVKGEMSSDADKVYQTVKDHYEKLGLTLLEQSKMNNGYAVAVRPETAQKYNLKTLSDLAKVSKELIMAAGPEFADRADGLPGMKSTYGIEFKEFKPMNLGLRYQAIQNKDVDVVNGFSTDGQISAMNLVTLTDDKNLWPPFRVAPVIRQDLLKKDPEIAKILNEVTALLTDASQAELNWRVDGKKEEPRDVARDFLKANGLVK